MALRERAIWLPAVLQLLQVPGCVSLSGPNEVMGTVGGSLQVLCRYEEKYRDHLKYWCKSTRLIGWKKIVATTASEKNVRSGCVSIRDEPAALTFTVTWENLTQEDAGTYGCGIDRPLSWTESWIAVTHKVIVTVSPATACTCISYLLSSALPLQSRSVCPCRASTTVPTRLTTSVLSPLMTSPPTTQVSTTWKDTPGPSQHHRSLLSSVHFLLLVFLKLPLFLSMLSAVLWVNLPQRDPAGKWGQPV